MSDSKNMNKLLEKQKQIRVICVDVRRKLEDLWKNKFEKWFNSQVPFPGRSNAMQNIVSELSYLGNELRYAIRDAKIISEEKILILLNDAFKAMNQTYDYCGNIFLRKGEYKDNFKSANKSYKRAMKSLKSAIALQNKFALKTEKALKRAV